MSRDAVPDPLQSAPPSAWNVVGMHTSPYTPEAPGANTSRDELHAFVGRQSELTELTSYVHVSMPIESAHFC